MAKIASKTYGEALFELADEAGKRVELMEEVVQLRKVMADNPEFDALLKHPGLAKQEKLSLCESVFRGKISDELMGLIETVVEKERFEELPAIFDYFIGRVKELEGIGIAYVTTAAPLSAEQKKAVEARILETTSYHSLEMHYGEDDALIGGMVIRIGDRVVDSSIRTKLSDLTRQLLQIQLA